MEKRRLLALLLAAAFAFALVPGAIFAAPEGESKVLEEKGGIKAHESYFNSSYTYITYTDVGSHDWVNKTSSDGSYKYLETGNAGASSSRCDLQTESIYMFSGEIIEFQYWYSTEKTYDHFDFRVNGEDEFVGSGESNGWQKFTYTVPSSGYYTFNWIYYKDGSTDSGSDCVRLAYCVYSAHVSGYAAQAALSAGGGGVTTGDATFAYAFYPVQNSAEGSTHPFYVRSGNAGIANSTSKFEVYCGIPDDGGVYKLSFDYALSCEATYDYMVFKDNGTVVFSSADWSSEPDYTWARYLYTIPSAGSHNFVWEYVKDGSDDVGSDCLCLDEIHLVGYDTASARFIGLGNINDSSSDADLIFNTPAGNGGFTLGSGYRAIPNNRYIDNSISAMETLVTMSSGETLSFSYRISSEKTYDKLRFYANGTEQLVTSGWTDNNYKTFTFTATENRTYLFRWEYVKDSSNSRGRDLACIKNVKYTGTTHNAVMHSMDTVLNHANSEVWLHYIGGAGVGGWFEPFTTPYWHGAVSRNKYYENSTSSISTQGVYLNATDKIEFKYLVSCEENNYDAFAFVAYRDGEEVHRFSDSGDNDWKTHTYVCEQGGLYTFRWLFAKDESDDLHEDRVIIDNVIVDRNEYAMFYAGNPDSDNPDDLEFYFFQAEEYPFVTEGDADGRYYLRSTNMGVNNSESILEAGTTVNGTAKKISFDYNVSSEAGYDYLSLFINGTEVWRTSGTENPGWHTYTTENAYSGLTELKWVYHKDGSTHRGDDRACIDNVCLVANGGLLGDVNCDGFVNANDALLLMRYALGIVPASALDITVADVNHDGNVNANDALTIMRAALGLITIS